MSFDEFAAKYDIAGAVVLLEGKREVREADKDALVAVGRLLASNTQHMVFRSGNAPGSDAYFSQGVVEIDRRRLEVITPYRGHRSGDNVAATTHSLDSLDLAAEDRVVYHSKQHAKTKKLVDEYVSGKRNPYAMKAAYILRDTVKVVGAAGIPQATAGVFYDDLSKDRKSVV
jgi:hypothetical protein